MPCDTAAWPAKAGQSVAASTYSMNMSLTQRVAGPAANEVMAAGPVSLAEGRLLTRASGGGREVAVESGTV